MQFSYNLYKKHYEEIQRKKMEWVKYPGHDRELWAKKTERGEPQWKTLGLASLIAALAFGAVVVVNYK
jgi:hypothetical protein